MSSPVFTVIRPYQHVVTSYSVRRDGSLQKKTVPAGRRCLPPVVTMVLAGAACLFPLPALATDPPGAGNVLRDLQAPVLKLPTKDAPVVDIAQPAPAPINAPADFRVQVNSVKITGASVYTPEQLLPLLQDLVGKEANFAGLEAMADRITQHYRKDGYILVRAYLPEQDIRNGELEIAVLEGRYDAIKVVGASGLQAANLPIKGLQKGAIVTEAPLERALLLLNDRPGVTVTSTLQPGAAVGSSDLMIDIAPGKRISGGAEFDNYGGSSTGKYRVGGELRFNNPTGFGDLLTVNGRTSGSGLQYGRIAYLLPIGGYGSKLGMALSDVHYELGEEFSSLHALGNARTATLSGSHPLVRSRQSNLNALLSVDSKRLHDSIDTAASATDKTSEVVTLGLSGDLRDAFGGGGVSAFSATYTTGRLNINSADAQATDDATAQTSGKFSKLNVSALRLQNLTAKSSLYASYAGQWAFKNLDSSEKMSLGGPNAVRAYAPGATPADSAHVVTVEWRHDLAAKWQLANFIDVGRATINKTQWPSATGPNSCTMAGFGLQMSWAEADDFAVHAFYSRKISTKTDCADNSAAAASRVGMQIGKSF